MESKKLLFANVLLFFSLSLLGAEAAAGDGSVQVKIDGEKIISLSKVHWQKMQTIKNMKDDLDNDGEQQADIPLESVDNETLDVITKWIDKVGDDAGYGQREKVKDQLSKLVEEIPGNDVQKKIDILEKVGKAADYLYLCLFNGEAEEGLNTTVNIVAELLGDYLLQASDAIKKGTIKLPEGLEQAGFSENIFINGVVCAILEKVPYTLWGAMLVEAPSDSNDVIIANNHVVTSCLDNRVESTFNRTIILWQKDANQLKGQIVTKNAVGAISLGAQQKSFIVALKNKQLFLCDIRNNSVENKLLKGYDKNIQCLNERGCLSFCIVLQGGGFEVASKDNNDTWTYEVFSAQGGGTEMSFYETFKDGSFVLSNRSNSFTMWSKDAGSRQWSFQLLKGHNDEVSDVYMLSDGLLLSASHDGVIIIWKKDRNGIWQHKQTLHYHSDVIDKIVELKNGSLITATNLGKLVFWKKEKNLQIKEEKFLDPLILQEQGVYFTLIKELENGSLLTCDYNGVLNVWKRTPDGVQWEPENLATYENGSTIITLKNSFVVFSQQTGIIEWFQNENDKWVLRSLKDGSSGDTVFRQLDESSFAVVCENKKDVEIWTKKNQKQWNCDLIQNEHEIDKIECLKNGELVIVLKVDGNNKIIKMYEKVFQRQLQDGEISLGEFFNHYGSFLNQGQSHDVQSQQENTTIVIEDLSSQLDGGAAEQEETEVVVQEEEGHKIVVNINNDASQPTRLQRFMQARPVRIAALIAFVTVAYRFAPERVRTWIRNNFVTLMRWLQQRFLRRSLRY